MTKGLIRAENDLIYHLDFAFKFPLPYDFTHYFIERLVTFHVPNHDLPCRQIIDELQDVSWTFLNDLQQSHLFTSYHPDTVAWAAVQLSFEKFGVRVASIRRHSCPSVLLPYRVPDEIEEAYGKIRQFFQMYHILDNLQQFSVEIDLRELQKWFIVPLDQVKPIDEMCPPPPLELMEEIAGDRDTFNQAWWEHMPDITPPSLDDLATAMAVPPPTGKRHRGGGDGDGEAAKKADAFKKAEDRLRFTERWPMTQISSFIKHP
jgi:hypothetical protein